MEQSAICQELVQTADSELQRIEKTIPEDPIYRFVLFTEVLRVMDNWGISQSTESIATPIATQTLDVMRMGWNLAATFLFSALKVPGFPISESTKESRSHIAGLLLNLGFTTLLRRAADMVKSGILLVDKKENTFEFRKSDIADFQYNDTIEFSNLEKVEDKINSDGIDLFNGWSLLEKEALGDVLWRAGNFMSKGNRKNFEELILSDIDARMIPLIRPWDSGHGIMMGYDSSPEIDLHFLAIASNEVIRWREDAGLHPDVDLDGIKGYELTAIVVFIVSYHFKHVHFASLASIKFPEISIPQSLTIWTPAKEIKSGIIEFTGIDKSVVTKAFDYITMAESDLSFLRRHTSKFMPLLIDLGNGFLIRPVSSLSHNPFFSIVSMLESRKPQLRNSISSQREAWLRLNVYAMFAGARYQPVEGTIQLKEGGNIVTDIDAAVYDNLSGELAIIQLKWQDVNTNEVSKLRSKASNLASEIDRWTEVVTKWIEKNGVEKLKQSLRIRSVKGLPTSVYLFAISRNYANVKGYGFSLTNDTVAIASWPQFVRNRTEIGPVDNVIQKMFKIFKTQSKEKIISDPLPLKFKIGEFTFDFKDLWSTHK